MAGIGHNSGRVDEPGRAFRTYAWGKARAALLPKLPIEVVRRRVLRAQELGLPYRTYAGLRAASGDDLIGFLFSSNALGVLRRGDAVAAPLAAKINALKDARTLGVCQGAVVPAQVSPPLDRAWAAPRPLAPWAETRDALNEIFAQARTPSSRVVLVCDTELELQWLGAARMAGALPARQFFATAP